jgi:butyrate kinase
MEGATGGAVHALDGVEDVMTYMGEPSWDGFELDGAPADVEA